MRVCVCDFVADHSGILAWLLVAALPVCLYSSADPVTPRSRYSLSGSQAHLDALRLPPMLVCTCVGMRGAG